MQTPGPRFEHAPNTAARSGQFHVRQVSHGMTRRYTVHRDTGAGESGELLAQAETPALRFSERMSLYTDDTRSSILATMEEVKSSSFTKSVGGQYRVRDAAGTELGIFEKDLRASMTRTTWRLRQPGLPEVVGRERSATVAKLRRAWSVVRLAVDIPFPASYHFDFELDGKVVLSMVKQSFGWDHYLLTVDDARLDLRLVFAQVVALDALQGR